MKKNLQDLSGPYANLKMGLKPTPLYVHHIDTGTIMYATEHSTMITSNIKSIISTDKEVGFGPITVQFFKRNRKFRYQANYLNCIMNGLITPVNMVNRDRMMLLSKKKNPFPPLNTIIPI